MYPVFRHREYTNVQRQASEQTNEQTAAVVDFTFQREKKAKNTMSIRCVSGTRAVEETKAQAHECFVFIPDQFSILHIVLHPEMDDHGRPELVDALRRRHGQ